MPDYNGYAVIWDVDGTLVDTAKQHYDAWVMLARELDKPFTDADFAATFGRRNPEIIRQLFGEHYNDQEVLDLGNRKEDFYREAARQGVEPLPGVRALMKDLHAAGYKQAIGSSAPRGNLELIMELTGLEHYFEAMVGQEDTSRGKPDPQVFLVAAQKLNVAPDKCLVLEDAIAGVQAAKAGGMKCIAVTFVGHHSDEILQDAGADLIVNSLEEVSVETVQKILG
ncbi:MAG TPA: HAD family phosphatase [Chloroflexia bacterium]|nr:HAD family phosphatase [Chloroflexia bacterium]